MEIGWRAYGGSSSLKVGISYAQGRLYDVKGDLEALLAPAQFTF